MNSTSAAARYGLIGHPVHHSRSPIIHGLFAEQTGQNLTYELIDADAEQLESALQRFAAAGGRGLNVTVPHKEAAFRLAERLGAEAEQAGAVNTLTFDPYAIRGDNTDGIGFRRDLIENLGWTIRGQRVLILGAGGAVRGILPPLLESAPAELVLANRTPARAEALAARFGELGKLGATGGIGATRGIGGIGATGGTGNIGGIGKIEIEIARFDELASRPAFDLVVNATSAGVKGEQPAFPTQIIGARTHCYDLAYGHGGTPFVAWARTQGAHRAEQGLGMLVEQAAESFFIWRRVRPDTAPVIHALRRSLGLDA